MKKKRLRKEKKTIFRMKKKRNVFLCRIFKNRKNKIKIKTKQRKLIQERRIKKDTNKYIINQKILMIKNNVTLYTYS